MSRFIEALHLDKATEAFHSAKQTARQKIGPRGLFVSTLLSTAAFPILVAAEGGLTHEINALAAVTDPNLFKLTAIGVLGLTNVASIALESRTLAKKRYSASLASTTFNTKTDKPSIAALGGHIYSYAKYAVLNPANVIALLNSDSKLAGEGAISTSLTMVSWYMVMNTLILKNRIDPVLDVLKSVGGWARGRIRRPPIVKSF